jgi:hypothetical protein
MPVSFKIPGTPTTWFVPTPGKILRKSGAKGAGSWVAAAGVKIKTGAKGTGSWTDSGYVGYPGMPATPTVKAWSYTSTTVKWTAPTSGAPVTGYDVQWLDVNNNVLNTYAVGATTLEHTRAVSPSTKYRIQVRAKGLAGATAYTAQLRISIGKDDVTVQKSKPATRAWSSAASVDLYRNEIHQGPVLPSSVDLTQIRVSLQLTFADNLVSNGGTRVNYIFWDDGAQNWPTGNKPNPWNELFNFPIDGTTYPGRFGIKVTGNGWSTRGQTTAWRLYGTVTGYGTEHYTYYYTETTPAVPNSYW